MRTKKKTGMILIIGGILLCAAALLLAAYNLYDEYRAGKSVDHVLETLSRQIPKEEETPSGEAPDESSEKPEMESAPGEQELPDYVLNPDMEMPTQLVENYYYIGILEIPDLGLTLPIMSEWSYPGLQLAPCRYSGSVYTDSLVIAGHSYRKHFGYLWKLSVGSQVIFTDVRGRRFQYEIAAKEVLEPTAIADMLSDEWDLSLFTCTWGGQARQTVRCMRIK